MYTAKSVDHTVKIHSAAKYGIMQTEFFYGNAM